jgi:hypothetical protein
VIGCRLAMVMGADASSAARVGYRAGTICHARKSG